jgi:hypothetical protein
MRRFVIGCAALVVGVLLIPGIASVTLAQDESSWMRVDYLQVLPRELDEFIELQLEEINPALRNAGVPWRSAWRTAEFGNTYERLFVTPIESLAELDFGGPLARVLEPDRLNRIRDRVRRTLASRQSYAVRYRPDLSVESDDVSGLRLAWITSLQVAPGRGADWEAFLRDNVPQFRGADVVFGVYERVFGPGASVWQIVENHASFAELDRPTILQRTFGERADEVAARLSGVLLSIERTVLQYDPELSFSAAAP